MSEQDQVASDQPSAYSGVLGSGTEVPDPVALSRLAALWPQLGFPPLVGMPRHGLLADMARSHQPIIIGRTLVRTHKSAGKWVVSMRDVRDAARDLAPLHTADLEERTELASDQDGWQSELAHALDSARLAREIRQRLGLPCERTYFLSSDWGFIDFAVLAEYWGEAWHVPAALSMTVEGCVALRSASAALRGRCSRCGQAVEDFHRQSVRTGTGWDGLCPACYAAHVEGLREYREHLRDLQYKKARARTNDRADLYRCVVCARPAFVWDHCHEHGFIRGPLCSRCNAEVFWLAGPYAFEAPPRPPIEHLNRCKHCVLVGPSPSVRALLIGAMLRRILESPIADCHAGLPIETFPDRESIAAVLAGRQQTTLAVQWNCPSCESTWQTTLDAGHFSEFDETARRFLQDGRIREAPRWQDRIAPDKVA